MNRLLRGDKSYSLSQSPQKELQSDFSLSNENHHEKTKICEIISERLMTKGYPFSTEKVTEFYTRLHKSNKPRWNKLTWGESALDFIRKSEPSVSQESLNDSKVQNTEEETSQFDFETDHKCAAAPARAFFMWEGEPTNCLLALVREYYSKTDVKPPTNMWTFIQTGMAKRGYSLTTRQIYSKYGKLSRKYKNFRKLVESEAGSSIKEKETMKDLFEGKGIDDSGLQLLNSDVNSSARCSQLDGATNADILQELREMKKERAEFYQNILKFLQERAQRRDENAERKEQFAINRYKLMEQFLKQKEKMSPQSDRML